MYRTVPKLRETEFEHIADARKVAIKYLSEHPTKTVFMYERKRGLEGSVFKSKKEYVFRSIKGVDHILNKDGTLRD